jgi:hypothetical protein
MTDRGRGDRYGYLILNVQIHIGANRLWIEPTFRPAKRCLMSSGQFAGGSDQMMLAISSKNTAEASRIEPRLRTR